MHIVHSCPAAAVKTETACDDLCRERPGDRREQCPAACLAEALHRVGDARQPLGGRKHALYMAQSRSTEECCRKVGDPLIANRARGEVPLQAVDETACSQLGRQESQHARARQERSVEINGDHTSCGLASGESRPLPATGITTRAHKPTAHSSCASATARSITARVGSRKGY
jgi:hypothetical protein